MLWSISDQEILHALNYEHGALKNNLLSTLVSSVLFVEEVLVVASPESDVKVPLSKIC